MNPTNRNALYLSVRSALVDVLRRRREAADKPAPERHFAHMEASSDYNAIARVTRLFWGGGYFTQMEREARALLDEDIWEPREEMRSLLDAMIVENKALERVRPHEPAYADHALTLSDLTQQAIAEFGQVDAGRLVRLAATRSREAVAVT